MKHSTNAMKAHANLKQALERMLKVLKNLNDSLHVVGLKGFPVSTNADIHDHYTYCMCKQTILRQPQFPPKISLHNNLCKSTHLRMKF